MRFFLGIRSSSVAVEDPDFNVWLYGTTYPVVALIPSTKHGIYKVHGFAVAHCWIYDCSRTTCMELNPQNLHELGYFDELPEEEEKNGDDEDKKLPAKKASAEPEGTDVKTKVGTKPRQVVEHLKKKYVKAQGVRHFAVMLNDWPKLKKAGTETRGGQPPSNYPYGPTSSNYGGGYSGRHYSWMERLYNLYTRTGLFLYVLIKLVLFWYCSDNP